MRAGKKLDEKLSFEKNEGRESERKKKKQKPVNELKKEREVLLALGKTFVR